MNLCIGDFREFTQQGGARVTLVFFPADFQVRWSQCSATADFFAEYFAAVPACKPADDDARADFIGTVSYVVNELVENAVKFSIGERVEVTVGLDCEELVVVVANQLAATRAEELSATFTELVAGDPQEQLFARVEQNAENPDAGGSGLGFLTMMSDYGAKIGWRFAPVADNPNNVLLETMARLEVKKP